MFPADRFEPAWTMSEPRPSQGFVDAAPIAGGPWERVLGRVPLGSRAATWTFVVYVDRERRLFEDWPGFPGTRGARVDLAADLGDDGRTITGTSDPALAALAEPVPLRRIAIERVNARCMVELGLAGAEIADYVACEQHGQGIAALACRHIIESAASIEATVVYDVDGAYPDLFCQACLPRYVRGDIGLAITVCSHCQQAHLYRHRLVERTWYGAEPALTS